MEALLLERSGGRRFLLFVREQREAQLEGDGVTLTFYRPLELILLPLQLCAQAVRDQGLGDDIVGGRGGKGRCSLVRVWR